MNPDIAGWLSHPVTLILTGVVVALLFSIVEVLLRSLSEIGNVRFQGLLEDFSGLVPSAANTSIHVSMLLDVLRWIEIGCVGVLWIVLTRLPDIRLELLLAICAFLPLALVILSRTIVDSVGERSLAVMLRLLRPVTWPLVSIVTRFTPAPDALASPAEDEEEEASEREIQAYLAAGEAAGIFEADEGEIVESLVEFFDTVVREVMTPRTEMVAISGDANHQDLVELFAQTHKSRIPVYRETLDDIVGVIHVKNLVEGMMGGEPASLSSLQRNCLVVPESKQLGDLLRDFQREQQQLAIVVDEYGGTSGLVTLEDVLEEIVGEIQDEHDPALVPESQQLSEGVYRLQGRAQLEVIEELFGLEVDDEDFDTVGGLVFDRHGTVPESGARIEDPENGLVFIVEAVEDRRIVSVVVERTEAKEQGDDG
ncbi:MAG: HlyC/CorC family transporter [bacterium]|nr:HlyC/CorC family transporter [bacterium]